MITNYNALLSQSELLSNQSILAGFAGVNHISCAGQEPDNRGLRKQQIADTTVMASLVDKKGRGGIWHDTLIYEQVVHISSRLDLFKGRDKLE